MVERLQWGFFGAAALGMFVGIVMLFAPGPGEVKLAATGAAAAFGIILGVFPMALFSFGLLGGGEN